MLRATVAVHHQLRRRIRYLLAGGWLPGQAARREHVDFFATRIWPQAAVSTALTASHWELIARIPGIGPFWRTIRRAPVAGAGTQTKMASGLVKRGMSQQMPIFSPRSRATW